MRKCFSAMAAVFALAIGLSAQPSPHVLSQRDIDRFVKDFPAIARELDQSGPNFDREVAKAQEKPGSFTPAAVKSTLRAAAADEKVRETLEKYGWNDRFWDVYYVVFVGVYVSMMDQALEQYPSPELKAQVDRFRASIPKDDHTLVLRNLTALVEAFDYAAEP